MPPPRISDKSDKRQHRKIQHQKIHKSLSLSQFDNPCKREKKLPWKNYKITHTSGRLSTQQNIKSTQYSRKSALCWKLLTSQHPFLKKKFLLYFHSLFSLLPTLLESFSFSCFQEPPRINSTKTSSQFRKKVQIELLSSSAKNLPKTTIKCLLLLLSRRCNTQ